jgi:chaperonin GroES
MKAKTTKSKLNLKPAAGYLLIEPLEAETKTASGIYLPDTAGEKPQKGKVLAVGEDEITDSGAKRSAPVKVGDIVFYKKWGGSEVKIGNIEYLFAKFEDILAIED